MKRLEGPAKGIRFTKKEPINTPISSIGDAIMKIPISLLLQNRNEQIYKLKVILDSYILFNRCSVLDLERLEKLLCSGYYVRT